MSQQHDDEFSYDDTPSGAQTFADQQPAGAGASGGGFDDFDDEVPPSLAPEKTTTCTGSITPPRKFSRDGVSGVVLDFTVEQPSEHAGYKHACFFNLKGGDSERCRRDVEGFIALAKQLKVPTSGSKMSDVISGVADAAAGAVVRCKLKKGNKGGLFANF